MKFRSRSEITLQSYFRLWLTAKQFAGTVKGYFLTIPQAPRGIRQVSLESRFFLQNPTNTFIINRLSEKHNKNFESGIFIPAALRKKRESLTLPPPDLNPRLSNYAHSSVEAMAGCAVPNDKISLNMPRYHNENIPCL